ncbi:MAG: hypothetical protein E6R08_00275 [Nevskiaceae bacterium]|nr:MAG: hypothetical protein E6R08_00275 [Nevskiaceae bacterium]
MNLQDLKRVARDLRQEPDERFIELQRFGRQANLRGHYTKDEFLAVCRWKSPRSSPLCQSNTAAKVRAVTRKAFAAGCEQTRMEALITLNGVAVPSASALLAVWDPTRFGVIDVRAWRLLHDAKAVTQNRLGQGLSISNWKQYLKLIQDMARDVGTTPRLVELAFYNAHKSASPELTLYGSKPRSDARWRCSDTECG